MTGGETEALLAAHKSWKEAGGAWGVKGEGMGGGAGGVDTGDACGGLSVGTVNAASTSSESWKVCVNMCGCDVACICVCEYMHVQTSVYACMYTCVHA